MSDSVTCSPASSSQKDVQWLPSSFAPGESDVIVVSKLSRYRIKYQLGFTMSFRATLKLPEVLDPLDVLTTPFSSLQYQTEPLPSSSQGRGKVCYMHPGNKHLAQMVQSTLSAYFSAESKKGKSELIRSITAKIRGSTPDGGFVKFDNSAGKWFEVGDAIAREKVSQIFRDALNDKYKSSTASKTLKRKQERISKLGAASSSALNTAMSKLGNESVENTMPMPSMMPSPSLGTQPLNGLELSRFSTTNPTGLDPIALRSHGFQCNFAVQSALARSRIGAGFTGIDPLSLMLIRREQLARNVLLGVRLQQPK